MRLEKKNAFLKSALASPLQFCLSMPTFVYVLIQRGFNDIVMFIHAFHTYDEKRDTLKCR